MTSLSVLYLVKGQGNAVYKPDSQRSPDNRAVGTLALAMLAFRAKKNEFLFFKPPH